MLQGRQRRQGRQGAKNLPSLLSLKSLPIGDTTARAPSATKRSEIP